MWYILRSAVQLIYRVVCDLTHSGAVEVIEHHIADALIFHCTGMIRYEYAIKNIVIARAFFLMLQLKLPQSVFGKTKLNM